MSQIVYTFYDEKCNMKTSLKDLIIIDINSKNLKVFCAKDFIHLAESKTINKSLERLVLSNKIRRVLTGIFYISKYIEILNDYESPSIDEIAKALARKNNWAITPTGNVALNKLGLSTQVPSKYLYLSSGTYKKYQIGNAELQFRRTNNRELFKYSEETNLIIQAIKTLGKNNITENDINRISIRFESSKKNAILEESKTTSMWIYEIIKKICEANHNV